MRNTWTTWPISQRVCCGNALVDQIRAFHFALYVPSIQGNNFVMEKWRSRITQLVPHIVAGALGGLAGGVMMTGAMTMGKKTGMVETPMPVKIEHWVKDQTGQDIATTPQQEMMASQGGHLVLSALFGAGYGFLQANATLPSMALGPLYGLGLYGLNLVGIAPRLGITEEPWNEETMTVGRQMMMHLLYGMVTAVVADQDREQLLS